MTQNTRKRRKTHEIRDLIQNSLSTRPRTVYEISKSSGIAFNTIQRHMQILKKLNVVTKFDENYWNIKPKEEQLEEVIKKMMQRVRVQ